MNLILLRHGETEWNTKHKLQGMKDIPLSAKGEEQAWALHDSLIKYGVTFEKIYVSPLMRAKKTAMIVTGRPAKELIIDDDLREMSFGVCEGAYYNLRDPEAIEKLPLNLRNFAQNPAAYEKPDGGEDFIDVIARTEAFYRRVLVNDADVKGNILVVSHGAALHALIYNIENKTDLNEYWNPKIGNCGAVTFKI